MVIVGGLVAHIQRYELSNVRWSLRQHVGCLFICWTKASFIAAIIYFLQVEYKLSLPLCFIATGLGSVFATDTIKKLYDLSMRWVFGKVGLPGTIGPAKDEKEP